MKPHCSRTMLYMLLPRNPNSQQYPSVFIQFAHLSTQSSNFHSQPSLSHSSRRYEDESRNVRVSVWWDFENCHIPVGVNVFRVAQTISAAIRANGMKGPIQITAFGDVQQLSRANQEALSSTGINLAHIPNGGKNSADRSLLVDLLYWVSRNPPPAHLFLISGDRDFAGILHRLRMSNYNILLASPESAPSVLCSAASILWHWNSMIKGEDLIGKLYNQPPDGPHGSWYGHYKAPLEDPFAVPEQPPPVKNEEPAPLEPSSELKVRPVPKVVMRSIYSILKENPEGISITELREELKRGNVFLDKDLFGYKKFSRFLLSLPHIVKLKFQHDGQFLVQPATVRTTEPSDSIGGLSSRLSMESGEVEKRISPNSKVESEERSSYKDESAKPELGIIAEESSEKTKPHTSTGENGGKLSQAVHEPPTLPKQVFEGVDTQSSKDNMPSVVQQDPKPQVGFFKRIWRRWFGDTDCEDPKRECEGNDNSADNSAERRGEEEAAKMVTKDVDQVNSKVSSSPSKELHIKNEVHNDSERRVFLHRIMSWCKFQGTTNEPEQVIDQSNAETVDKKSNDLSKDCIFSQESFWSDVKSFLNSPRGSNVVSQSRTRGALAKSMRKCGPAVLGTLSDTDLLHLVNLLISEKKLVEENISQVFPFRLSQPWSHGSKGLSSIFDKPLEQEGEKKVPNISHTGISSPIFSKKPADRPRNQILADVQKLVQELLVQFPEGHKIACFRKLFLEKYGYPLDLQKLGYLKVTNLLQVIPGVSLESGQMFPSSRVQQAQCARTVTEAKSASSSDGDSSDSWDELGPLTKESSSGRTKLLEHEATLLDEEEVSSGSEDDLNPAGEGGRHKKQKNVDDDSSLMQILDSWYSKEPGRGNSRALKPEEADVPQLSKSSCEQSEWRPRQQKVYSFVADSSGGGEREKQVEGILSSLKKRKSEQKIQQQT